jgi:hypothetical protein
MIEATLKISPFMAAIRGNLMQSDSDVVLSTTLPMDLS